MFGFLKKKILKKEEKETVEIKNEQTADNSKERILTDYAKIAPVTLIKSEKTVKIGQGIEKIKINAFCATVTVRSSDTDESFINYTGDCVIEENESVVSIKETENLVTNSNYDYVTTGDIVNGNKTVINGNGVAIGGNCNNCIINESRVATNNLDMNVNSPYNDNMNNLGEANTIELVIPKNMPDLNLEIDSKNGPVSLKNLIFSKLIVQTVNGSINLEDIDAVFISAKLVNGSLKAEILESILNYRTILNSMNGKASEPDTTESVLPELLTEKHQLRADTINGDIHVLFKGKK